GLRHDAEVERVEQAGLDHRRFAGAGRAEDGQEPAGREAVDHRGDAILAAEEEIAFLASERAQARIGHARCGARAHARNPWRMPWTRCSRLPSWQSTLSKLPDQAISDFGAGGPSTMVLSRSGSSRSFSSLL